MIDPTLEYDEARRAAATLGRFRSLGVDHALTGGLAIAWHTFQDAGTAPIRRPLHDLDLVVESLQSIPTNLGKFFEVWHVHADAPRGRMLVQLYDRSTALRIDVFSAYGDTLRRCRDTSLSGTAQRVVSREDLVARLASLLLDLARGESVAPKHAKDFSALLPNIDMAAMAAAWQDHRRSRHPADFDEACATVLELVKARPDLLVSPESPYLVSPCSKCGHHAEMQVTQKQIM